ncbi:MAG: chemotaxis protein CheW [Lentisphaerota bacterium]
MSSSATPVNESKRAQAGKYLTFKIAAEEYGIEILKVQEIIKSMDITKIPRTPGYVRGVINLRGKVIPVVDLRMKFGMESQTATEKTCIVVAQVATGSSTVTTGLVVDEVSEVLDIAGQEIEACPSFGAEVDTQFILGMAKTRSGVKILLDIDRVMAGDSILSIMQVA